MGGCVYECNSAEMKGKRSRREEVRSKEYRMESDKIR